MNFPYEDIVKLHRPESRHAPMPLFDRGAQFAPFAALRGYDEVIRRTQQEKVEPIELSDEGKAQINETLCLLFERLEEQPEAVFTHYRFDPYTEVGTYETLRGRVKSIDPTRQMLTLADEKELSFSRIAHIAII